MFSQRGHLTLAHNDASLRTMRWRAEVNKIQGVDSEVIGPDEIKRARPVHGHLGRRPATRSSARSTTRRAASSATTPWCGATPGRPTRSACTSTSRPRSPASTSTDGRVTGVQTNRGRDRARRSCVNCTAGWATPDRRHGRGASCRSQTFPLQAAVTEPVKPFLDTVVVSGTLHVYVSQTDRGELVFGASVDPFASYSMRGSLEFTEGLAGHVLRADAVAAEDAGAAPVGRAVRHDPRLLADHGTDTGRRASSSTSAGAPTASRPGPVVRRGDGRAASPTAAPPEIIAAFGLARFADGRLVGEKGAAAVGH